MFATVVVDIPDINHKGFTYEIPETLLAGLKKGCRVLVPVGSRTNQGFVIDITDKADLPNVKQIKENLDITPSITEELIELGLWMSKYYSSHLFTTLQILIPSAFKTKKVEYIVLGDLQEILKLDEDLDPEIKEILDWVSDKQPLQFDYLLNQFSEKAKLIQKMLQSGYLKITKEFKDKGTFKKVSFVKLLLSKEALLAAIAELPSRAVKQQQILKYFLTNNNEIELSLLLSKLKLNRTSITSLIEKGYLQIVEEESLRDPYKNRNFNDKTVNLTQEQELVLKAIIDSLNSKKSHPILLHGVTGSGKTEIYLNAINYILKLDKTAIVLVPEISLTPQMVERFKGRFGNLVAVLHSRLSQGERLDEWRRIQTGQAKIAIGARSAIFAPFKDLGLIIIDEEHESSYKQEEHPKYHVRDVAIWRSAYHNAVVVLGSATPSLESYFHANANRYQLLKLPNRIMGRSMPTVNVVDMRDELRVGNRSMFSHTLQAKIEERLNKKEQIVLFLNRRGFSTFVMCRACGYVLKCPHCEISLTYHHTNQVLRCHYCGYAEKTPRTCPECGSSHIRYFGTGTQKVETELAKRFPGVKVIRMDVDTTTRKGAHEKLLNAFRNEEADILLGTQMIAKGLDFPKVTLVGVIAADTMLRLPDFRSAERTFQLLTQVSGRAGRHELAGDVVIQTYTPEHYSIKYAGDHDFQSFYFEELQNREIMNYPPYKKLIVVHFSHIQIPELMKTSERFVRELKLLIEGDTEVLGPVTSPISRIKDRYRFQCMIKYNNEDSIMVKINEVINLLNKEYKDRQLLISVDVDPYVLL